MPKQWSRDELRDILTHATPIVRKFLKGLASRGSATAEEIGVHHMAAAIGHRYAKSRGKEPLYSTVKDESTGKSVFTLDRKYRSHVASFLANFKAPPPPPKRGPGRPRKVDAMGVVKRGSGRPRKVDAMGMAKRGPGRPRKTEMVTMAGAPVRRGPGRPRKNPLATTGRINGHVVLPSDAMNNWSFWTSFVAFANQAAQARKSLRITTDGSDVRVEVGR